MVQDPDDADARPRPRRILVGPFREWELAEAAMQRLKLKFETLIVHELHDEDEVDP